MVVVRSLNEIILSLLDYYDIAQPDLSLNPGGVSRDLFVDGPASQIAILYDELSASSNKQSFRLVEGIDLDKLAKNFGLTRKQATPSAGVALFTFSSITSTININKGDSVIAKNGFSYSVLNGVSVNSSSTNFYRSVASKYRDQLDSAGISDQFAVEITVRATSSGTAGNIGKFSLSRTNVSGVSNVTNINSFVGGTDQEGDGLFRNRILSAFSGSSVGTALGYQSAALNTDGVTDVTVVEPGSSLMTRDGTIVSTTSDGSKTILSEGTGGKVDVVVLGSKLVESFDSFIYRDKSNNNDPSNSKNDLILGQIVGDDKKTINKRRKDNIKNGTLPEQPIDSLISVTGSISGANFKEKTVDSFGRISGNYELIKDVGAFGGSPFGFDTFHWISDRISGFSEDRIKGQLNGQDSLIFTDVTEIPQVQQKISIVNENSSVTFDRSVIQLLHTPAINVTRVFNVNTGERYIVTNQNIDSTGFNSSGKVKISGNTLPSASDILQVDYTWVIDYDQYSDYDGLVNTENPREVTDSVDWGFSSVVKNEKILFSRNLTNNFFVGNTSLPTNTIISANQFSSADGYVEIVLEGLFKNRLQIVLNELNIPTESIDSIKIINSNKELYQTAQNDGSFSNVNNVLGINIVYTTKVILPQDTLAKSGDRVTVILNSKNVFLEGSNSGNSITIPGDKIDTPENLIYLNVTYICNTPELFNSSIIDLPSVKSGNGYYSGSQFSNVYFVNQYKRENSTIKLNLSNQFYFDLQISSLNFDAPKIVSVIRLSDGKELWNNDNEGSVTISSNNNYQIILNGFNNPLVGNKVLAIYSVRDNKRSQPFTYFNSIIKTRIDFVDYDSNVEKFFTTYTKFENESDINVEIIEPTTNKVVLTFSDGYLIANERNAFLTTNISLNNVLNLKSKKIKISGSILNNGTYNVLNYDSNLNQIEISSDLENIAHEQISVIRLADGQEIWNNTSSKDLTFNRFLFSGTTKINPGDKVFILFFNYDNLKKSPTRLISTVTDQIISPGVLSINGTTLYKASNVIFTTTNSGLKLNLNEAFKKSLGLNSAGLISSNIKLVKVLKLEKVTTVNSNSDEVLTIDASYDLKNQQIKNNLFYSDQIKNDSLSNTEVILPSTSNNNLVGEIRNLPILGDKFKVTFYYVIENDSENLSYSKNGTLYTNKKFATIDKISILSGFGNSQSTKLNINSFAQPSLGARYSVFYDYLAPKQNERISVGYNYNRLISDVTFNVENVRSINSDVLIREAKLILLDLTINVVLADSVKNISTTVIQNLRDKLLNFLATTTLGETIDVNDLINQAQSVTGIIRARILYFNKTGGLGTLVSIKSQEDEYFAPNNLIINTETR